MKCKVSNRRALGETKFQWVTNSYSGALLMWSNGQFWGADLISGSRGAGTSVYAAFSNTANTAQSVIIEYSDNFSPAIGSGIMIEIVIVDMPQ